MSYATPSLHEGCVRPDVIGGCWTDPIMAACGTSRHFAATQQFSRYRSETDMQRAALKESDL